MLHSNKHLCSVPSLQAFIEMQFTRGLIALTTLFTMAAATGNPPPAIPASQCNTGPVQCCQQTGFADEAGIATALGLVGVVVDDLNVFLGATCSPISVIGVPGNSWLVILYPQCPREGANRVYPTALPSPFAALTIPSVSHLKRLRPPIPRVQYAKYLSSFFLDGIVAIGCTPVNINL